MPARFGPAGRPVTFKGKTEDVPLYLKEIGLNAFEYQAVRSLRISKPAAEKLRLAAEEASVTMSMHGPYALNLSSDKEDTVKASIERLAKAVEIASWMGAYLVVFHPGYYSSEGRAASLKSVIKSLKQVSETAEEMGVLLGPETTGRIKQVGDLEETIEICKNVPVCKPVIDFAHLYARSKGYFSTKDQFVEAVTRIENELGAEAVKPLHVHFSCIEYGSGGEKRHHPLDSGYGPDFEKVAEALVETGVQPIIISESPILEKDAVKMKNIYFKVLETRKRRPT